jgi:hypothetical protein
MFRCVLNNPEVRPICLLCTMLQWPQRFSVRKESLLSYSRMHSMLIAVIKHPVADRKGLSTSLRSEATPGIICESETEHNTPLFACRQPFVHYKCCEGMTPSWCETCVQSESWPCQTSVAMTLNQLWKFAVLRRRFWSTWRGFIREEPRKYQPKQGKDKVVPCA